MTKSPEILDELRMVLGGRSNLLDSVLPPLFFVVLYAIRGLPVAIWVSLGLAVVIALYRLVKHQSWLNALGGVGGVVLAVAIALLSGRAADFFLPGIVSGSVSVLLSLVSILAGRPMVAFTSYLARRWPLKWYWHLRVRPAYSEVTWIWFIFFSLRLLLQLSLFQGSSTSLLGIVQLLTGWPATILLLIGSYVYGTWRLRNLGGPSVDEYKSGVEPPWQGQQRGF